MKTKKVYLLLLLFITTVVMNTYGQEIPRVYFVENTGVGCVSPTFPEFSELPIVEPLTDPFEWSDGSGRDTTFENWRCRRAEIKAEIEHYEIGTKPERPDTISASYTDGVLTVNITVNGNTLTLHSSIVLPDGDGPFPGVIGIGGGTGSLPGEIFSSRNIAQIPFNFGEVMAHTQARGSEPINKLYPELIYMGAYSAWSWGISRLIDGLELVADSLPIDLSHLAVTGCSYAGKMALFAGAFDERIALTIAQESGGGGAAAWRVSETVGPVETLGATNHGWFIEDMFKFAGANTAKLPHDHHELMAMVAPRALLVLGNPDYVWLADESGYVSCKAAEKVWDNFGISDRFGFSIVGGHGHCGLPDVQRPEVEAFVEKFLLDNEDANTTERIHPYDETDWPRWMEWWGTGVPEFGKRDQGTYYEAECTEPGANWDILQHNFASGGSYVRVKPDLESIDVAPTSGDDQIQVSFTVEKDTTYKIYARLRCKNDSQDAFWVKMDDGTFEKYDGLRTVGWQWKLIDNFELTAGEHTIYFAYCELGADIDKICISDFMYPPQDYGGEAVNSCTVGINDHGTSGDSYKLGQNYPNPFSGNTTISFEIPKSTYVSLKVYNMLGEEIAELVGNELPAGEHSVDFNHRNLSKGVYFYSLKADNFMANRKMILQGE